MFTSLFRHLSQYIFSSDLIPGKTYEAFKNLLEQDGRAHELMAEIEMLYHDGKRLDYAGINKLYNEFSTSVEAMVHSLATMHHADAASLLQYHKKFNFYSIFLLAPPEQPTAPPYTLNITDISDPALSGNKAYNLALLRRKLHAPVPDGFVITTHSFNRLLSHNNLRKPLDDLLAVIDIEDTPSLQKISRELISLICSAEIPPEVAELIDQAYAELEQKYDPKLLTAVRSSAVSEDGIHSFAGQYHTELEVNRNGIFAAYLNVLSSKYSPEALFYRITLGYCDEDAAMGVLVLPMVDAATSGIIYTTVSDSGECHEMAIHSIYGLGEILVSGMAEGDIAHLDKKTGQIAKKIKGKQSIKRIHAKNGLEDRVIETCDQEKFCVKEKHLLKLGRWAGLIERHFGCPQDIEWAIDREENIFILQSRPLQRESTILQQNLIVDPLKIRAPHTSGQKVLLSNGRKASGGIAAGSVFIAGDTPIHRVKHGSVLVTGGTSPSLVRILGKIIAVIAEQGSIAGHFSTVCREFGIPCIIGAHGALKSLQPGQIVTVDGDNQVVYEGADNILLQNPKEESEKKLPYFRKLEAVMDFITPLKLLNPEDDDFQPEHCRSLHDIIRYTHEKAVRSMFSLGEHTGRVQKKQLHTSLPLTVNLLNLGSGFSPGVKDSDLIRLEDICCQPFLALWKGLSHTGIDWDSHSHFDWKTFDDVALAGGFISKNSSDLASFAILSHEYLNLNMRFGYHFTLVDTLCGQDERTNYCQIRFAGGGGNYSGRYLRLEFLNSVLDRLGFNVSIKGDLLDARILEIEAGTLCSTLDMLGRLLGATKLMDMVLMEKNDVTRCVDLFFKEQYCFTKNMSENK